MTWKLVLLILLCLVVIVAVYYLGYALIFVYLFLCGPRRFEKRGRVARKLFSSIAADIDETRGRIDPESLRSIDQRMSRNTPPMVLLIGIVLAILGWLTAKALRYLIS